MIFAFDANSFFQNLETEGLVLILIVVITTQWKYYTDYMLLYNKTNKFADIYEMQKHFIENKKSCEIDSQLLKDLKCSVDLMNGKIIHLDANVKQFKNESTSSKLYDLVKELHDRLDNLKKNEKNI